MSIQINKGLAYAIDGKVSVHSKWNSKKYRDTIKPKTIILLDEDGNMDQFGADAKDVLSHDIPNKLSSVDG